MAKKGEFVSIEITVNDEKALAAIDNLQKKLDKLKNTKITIAANDVANNMKKAATEAKQSIDKVRKEAEKPIKNTLQTDTASAKAQYERMRNEIQSKPIRVMTALGKAGGGILSVANTFSKLLDNPLNNAFKNVGATATSMLTTNIFQGISKIGERFDTFKLYEKQMKQMGASSADAQKAINDLDKAVQGLPTSLSDITKEQKLFFSMTGDINKATDMAIAANNAFLASGANESQREQGMKQIKNMLASGELTGKQWISLANAMPGAIRMMGKTAKLSGEDLNRWVKDVTAGKRPVKEFLQLLREAGTGEGLLVRQAAIAKQSFSGWQANFQTAIARFGQKTLEALDSSLKKNTGEGLIAHLYKINDGINKLAETVVKWIQSHPEEIDKWLNRLNNFDWMGFARGVGNAGKLLSNFVALLAKMPGGLAGFIVAGGGSAILKGIYPIGGILKSIGQFGEMKSKFKGAEKAAEGVASASTNIGKNMTKAGGAFGGMKGAIGKIGGGLQSLGRFGSILGGAALTGAVVAESIGVIWLAGKAFGSIAKMNIPFKKLQKNLGILLLSMGEVTTFFAGIGALMTNPVGGAVMGFSALSAALETGIIGAFTGISKMLQSIIKVKVPSTSKIQKVGKATKDAMQAISNIGIGLDWFVPRSSIKTGVISGYVKTFTDLAKELADASKSIDKISEMGFAEKIQAILVGADSPFRQITSAISDMAGEKTLWQSAVEKWKTSNFKKTFDSITKIIGDLKESLGNMDSIENTINKFGGRGYDADALFSKAENAMGVIKGLIRIMKDAFGEGVGATSGAKMEATRIGDFKKLASNVGDAIKAVADIFTNSGGINEAYKSMLNAFGSKGKGGKVEAASWETVKGSIKTQIGNITTLIDELFGDKSTYGSKLKHASSVLKGVNMENVAKVFGDLQKALVNLSKLHETMGKVGGLFAERKNSAGGAESTAMDALFDKIGSMVDRMIEIGNKVSDPDGLREKMFAIRKMMASLVYAMGSLNIIGTKTADVDPDELFEPVETAVNSMLDIANKVEDPDELRSKMYAVRAAFEALKTAMQSATSMPAFKEGQDATTVSDSVTTIITNVGNALARVPDIQNQANGFAAAVSKVMGAVQDIMSGQYSIKAFYDALLTIPNALTRVTNAMKGKGKLWKESLVNGFKGTANDILTIIRNIPAKLIEVTGFMLAGQIHGNNYKTGFESAISNLELPDGVTVTSTTTPRVHTSNSGNVNHNGEGAHGDRVRFATGGEVNGPGGIDNVPARLTKGEYVQRTAAVDTFGLDFMEKVNNLDVKGALTSLSTRIGARLVGGTTVHNYNNQQVVQHIHTNNENWSYMRANKFVRGLS